MLFLEKNMRPIKNRNLFLLLLGRSVSDLGTSIQMMIMPLYIIDIGRTAADIGLLSFLYLLPILIVFPFAGVIGDSLNRKFIMVSSDLFNGSVILVLALLSHLGKMPFFVLVTGQMLVGISFGFFEPANKGMLPALVEPDGLQSANAKIASLRITAGMLAPVLGVFLYSWLGITALFLINGTSFILSGISEAFIRYSHKPADEKLNIKIVLHGLKDGLLFVKHTPLISKLCVYFLIITTFVQPLFGLVLPLLFKTQLQMPDAFYGYTQTAFVAGALLGSVYAGVTGKRMGLFGLFSRGNRLLPLAFSGFALLAFPAVIGLFRDRSFLYLIALSVCLMCLSASLMLATIPVQTFIQKSTPSAYMSRVFSIVGMIGKAGAPLGSLIFGFILAGQSLHLTVAATAGVIAVVAVVFMNVLKNDVD